KGFFDSPAHCVARRKTGRGCGGRKFSRRKAPLEGVDPGGTLAENVPDKKCGILSKLDKDRRI
ncbi:MAG: hypothetical protein RRY97_07345, partial [Oscillibacter sp.]